MGNGCGISAIFPNRVEVFQNPVPTHTHLRDILGNGFSKPTHSNLGLFETLNELKKGNGASANHTRNCLHPLSYK